MTVDIPPACADTPPPWVQHSRMQTQQELCAKRFVRLASLRHVHGTVALWGLALWFAGVPATLAALPVAYFSGPALFRPLRRLLGFEYEGTSYQADALREIGLERLSRIVLALNAANAIHLALMCTFQGHTVMNSPMFAFLPLSRVFFGLFTREVHMHFAFSTMLAIIAVCCNAKLVVGSPTLLIVVAALLMELTAIVVLFEGPCGYEEAIMHLAQCRAQHQLLRSQAVQRIDVEREEFSGQLLAIATQGIAELTGAVQRASDPVLNMLKSSCATGTKSVHEAERIGQIGESLKEEVAAILRFKTQAAWSKLQERAKQRRQQLSEHAASHEASAEAMLLSIHHQMGMTLAQVHQLELEAESSLDQMIQGEINRAMETADARMDLVRQSAQAMECRVSDTVEVLLSLLRYFRSKDRARSQVVVRASAKQASHSAPRQSTVTSATDEHRSLPSIQELCVGNAQSDGAGDDTDAGIDNYNRHTDMKDNPEQSSQTGALPCSNIRTERGLPILQRGSSLPTGMKESKASTDGESPSAFQPNTANRGDDDNNSASAQAAPQDQASAAESRSSSSFISDIRDEDAGGTSSSRNEILQCARPTQGSLGGPGDITGPTLSHAALDQHPLFASRLSYRTKDFFWSWATSRDFRAEGDAVRQWQRAAAASSASTTSHTSESGVGSYASNFHSVVS